MIIAEHVYEVAKFLSRNLRSDFEVKYIITSFKKYEVIDSLGKEPRLKCVQIKQKVGVNNKKQIYVRKGKLYIILVDFDTDSLWIFVDILESGLM